MKKIALLSFLIFALVFACAEDDNHDSNVPTNQTIDITFKFTHNWDGIPVTNSDFNSIIFTNDYGNQLSIEKLRYLISNIKLSKPNSGTLVFYSHKLVDVTNNENLTFTFSMHHSQLPIQLGEFENISFTFGFVNEDNYSNYPDLTSALWNVPEILGGGYHFMQLEGKFIDNTGSQENYAYHTIRAVDNSNAPNLIFEDTFFEVNLGPANIVDSTVIEVKMNIAKWFKDPNTWDLNMLNSMLMSNFDAQVMMYENGQNVFSLGTVTP